MELFEASSSLHRTVALQIEAIKLRERYCFICSLKLSKGHRPIQFPLDFPMAEATGHSCGKAMYASQIHNPIMGVILYPGESRARTRASIDAFVGKNDFCFPQAEMNRFAFMYNVLPPQQTGSVKHA